MAMLNKSTFKKDVRVMNTSFLPVRNGYSRYALIQVNAGQMAVLELSVVLCHVTSGSTQMCNNKYEPYIVHWPSALS